MYCKNCGTEFNENDKVCPNCGQAIEGDQNPITNDDKSPKSKKSFNFKPKYVIAAVAALIVICAVCTFAFGGPYVKDFYARTIKNPTDYYHDVEEANRADNVEFLTNAYSASVSKINSYKNGTKSSLEVNLGSDLQKLLEQNAGISNVKSAKIDMQSSYKEDGLNLKAEGSINDSKVLSASMIYDLNKNNLYTKIPEFNDSYINIETTPMDTKNFKEMKTAYDKMLNNLPDNDTFSKIVNRYTALIPKDLSVSEKISNVPVTVNGATTKCTELDIALSEKDCYSIELNILKTLKDDDDVNKIVSDYDISASDYNDELDREIKSLESRLDSASDKKEAKMKVFVDHKGAIVGRQFEIDKNGKTNSFGYLTTFSSNKLAFKLEAQEDNEVQFNICADLNKASSDSLSGNITLNVKNINSFKRELRSLKEYNADFKDATDDGLYTAFNIEVSDLKFKDLKNGNINGTFEITTPYLKDDSLSLTLNSDDKSSAIGAKITRNNDLFVEGKLTCAAADPLNLESPSASEKVYNANDSEDMYEYTQNINPEEFINKIQNDTGIKIRLR